ncbi:hypothetical protein M8C21_016728 [Ambrosia artemisiifolia]|uniref:Probable cytosolic iron-sulfur protein assembly protein CIAO1 homolog n=1 Tax=Ambrosia artemisiifolia TaxID=4212 RepID=A0AAD5CSI9_AMBAR|nr:hypothetical protein M8C21_016728 [Ambrosia artemisiifolia]
MTSIEEEGLQLKELQTLTGHTDRVWGLAWNPVTGTAGHPSMLASCGGDKTVRIWQQQQQTPNSTSFHSLEVLEEIHTRTVRSCVWSPSGEKLATASFDATTAILEQNGNGFECVSTLEGHENEVKSVSWNASGSLLATCSRDKCVWIWEVLPGNEFDCVSVLQGHTQDVKMVQWHPTVDVLFSCSYDNTIKVWAEDGDSDDWRCVQTLNESNCGHSSTVWAISFNATGEKMVTCSDDLTIKVWGVDIARLQSGDTNASWEGIIATGAADDAICLFIESEDHSVDGPKYKLLLKKEKAHDMDINAVRWSPTENRLLASASDDGTIKIWKLDSIA